MLIAKFNKKIALYNVQLFVCCHPFCLCADVIYLLRCLGRYITHKIQCKQVKLLNGQY